MFLRTIIFLSLFSVGGWAQNPPKDVAQPTPATSQPAVSAPELPPIPTTPTVPTTQPSSGNEEVPPGGAFPEGAVPGAESTEFASAELETLKPTNRDPFAKPKSLIEKEVETQRPTIDPSIYIDMRIEPIRRFPLRNYVLVGIIFDVDNPKAMVRDPENNMHLLTTNQRIGNQEGLIVKIERGELVVEEKGKIVSIKLHK